MSEPQRPVKYEGADWVRHMLPEINVEFAKKAKRRGEVGPALDAPMSPLGVRVADILGQVNRGIYHIRDAARNTDWTNRDYIRVPGYWQDLSTVDGNALLILVVLCHDSQIRLTIKPHAFKTVTLFFSQRQTLPPGE